MDHDHSYKLLFSHPEMVADLLRGFVIEDWVKDLDFTTLERVSGCYVAATSVSCRVCLGHGRTMPGGAVI